MRDTSKMLIGTTGALLFWLVVGEARSQSHCDLLKTAQQFIAERYPDFDAAGLRPLISDSDTLWELTYELPKGTLGGAPIITIDKRTCKIIRVEHSQ